MWVVLVREQWCALLDPTLRAKAREEWARGSGAYCETLPSRGGRAKGRALAGVLGLLWGGACEFFVAVFQIADDLRALREMG